MEHITIEKLETIAKDVLRLSKMYSNSHAYGEIWFWNALLLGFLEGKYGHIKREHTVVRGRIDFRRGGSNPVIIELAIRKSPSTNTLSPSQNFKELLKLTKQPQSKAKARYLLLIDACKNNPIPKAKLMQKYQEYNAGPGNFQRKRVKIVYVHSNESYHFLWPQIKH